MGNIHASIVICWPFPKLTISKTSFRNTIRVSNGLHPDTDQYSVGPNLLHRLSKDDKNHHSEGFGLV